MKFESIKIWIRYLFPLFLACFLAIFIFMLAQFREPPGSAWRGIAWLVGSIFLIWEFGWRISQILERRLPWRKGIVKRLLLQLLATNLFGMCFFIISYLLLNWYETNMLGSLNALGWLHIVVVMTNSFILVQIVNSFQIGYQFLQVWQEVQLEAEAFKKEHVISRLESLREQIDSQFLEDNFTVLESMIQEAPEKASSYLKELFDHYQNNQNHLVSTLVNVQQSLKEEKNKTVVRTDRTSPLVPSYKTRFLVRSGVRFFLIPIEDIVAFYKDEVVLLFTKAGKKYVIDGSLEDIHTQLPPKYFFRINRQCIIHARYLAEMRMEGNQMQLTVSIPFPKKLNVSQRNVSVFKRWMTEEI